MDGSGDGPVGGWRQIEEVGRPSVEKGHDSGGNHCGQQRMSGEVGANRCG